MRARWQFDAVDEKTTIKFNWYYSVPPPMKDMWGPGNMESWDGNGPKRSQGRLVPTR